ncbi:hypothetical protein FA15DRAFT_658762 [Coprinopsis marcescibilis]|uniref:Uncharacterized protein n=1 Tax=Coprinopsis marcescibilis TaxID=230819 RepID=A0A5C3KKT7_COPMA|nr:hypothetical protein FA15DRAFT_658762 [Coprinopsis marcescibilis]
MAVDDPPPPANPDGTPNVKAKPPAPQPPQSPRADTSAAPVEIPNFVTGNPAEPAIDLYLTPLPTGPDRKWFPNSVTKEEILAGMSDNTVEFWERKAAADKGVILVYPANISRMPNLTLIKSAVSKTIETLYSAEPSILCTLPCYDNNLKSFIMAVGRITHDGESSEAWVQEQLMTAIETSNLNKIVEIHACPSNSNHAAWTTMVNGLRKWFLEQWTDYGCFKIYLSANIKRPWFCNFCKATSHDCDSCAILEITDLPCPKANFPVPKTKEQKGRGKR